MTKVKPNRIPSLDGLRAISVLMVVLGHAGGHASGFPRALSFASHSAALGVDIFFVISGFLITTLLLEEINRTGTVSLKEFYIRRAYRILPAAYTVILVVAIFLHNYVDRVSIISSVLYARNWFPNMSWPLGHLWSLSVEEQFYLLWPFLLITFFRHRVKILMAAILIAPVCRLVFTGLKMHTAASWWFPCVQDALAIGCLLAVIKEPARRVGQRLDRFILLIAALVLVMPGMRYPHGVQPLIVLTLVNFGIAACIEHVTRRPPRWLNWSPLVWIGTLSYSIYLVQQPFFTPGINHIWTRFPGCLVAILAAAILLHYGVEKPFLRIRARRNVRRQEVVKV